MNKKALFGLSVEQLVRLTVVIIIVIAFFAFGGRLYAAVFGEKQPEAAQSMKALAEQIDLMLQRDTTFEYAEILLVIPEKENDHRIRGFSSDESGKPDLCSEISSACLCLQKGSETDLKTVSCVSVGQGKSSVKLLTLTGGSTSVDYPSPVPASGYGPLVVENKIKSGTVPAINLFKGGLFYVEKYASLSGTFILVNFISDEGAGIKDVEKKQRIAVLSPCPADSHADCVGKLRNSKTSSGAFCKYDSSKDICNAITAPACDEGEETMETCVCGSQLIDKGLYCLKNDKDEYYADYFKCEGKISSCNDYCTLDDGKGDCVGTEKTRCVQNPCKLAKPCLIVTHIPEDMTETVFDCCRDSPGIRCY